MFHCLFLFTCFIYVFEQILNAASNPYLCILPSEPINPHPISPHPHPTRFLFFLQYTFLPTHLPSYYTLRPFQQRTLLSFRQSPLSSNPLSVSQFSPTQSLLFPTEEESTIRRSVRLHSIQWIRLPDPTRYVCLFSPSVRPHPLSGSVARLGLTRLVATVSDRESRPVKHALTGSQSGVVCSRTLGRSEVHSSGCR